MYSHMNVYEHVHMYVTTYTYVCVCVYAYACVCVHRYMYMYTYMKYVLGLYRKSQSQILGIPDFDLQLTIDSQGNWYLGIPNFPPRGVNLSF